MNLTFTNNYAGFYGLLNVMSNGIKGGKSKFAWILIGVVLLTMIISFVFAYFFNWGWIVSIITALCGGFILRKLIVKKIDDYVKS